MSVAVKCDVYFPQNDEHIRLVLFTSSVFSFARLKTDLAKAFGKDRIGKHATFSVAAVGADAFGSARFALNEQTLSGDVNTLEVIPPSCVLFVRAAGAVEVAPVASAAAAPVPAAVAAPPAASAAPPAPAPRDPSIKKGSRSAAIADLKDLGLSGAERMSVLKIKKDLQQVAHNGIPAADWETACLRAAEGLEETKKLDKFVGQLRELVEKSLAGEGFAAEASRTEFRKSVAAFLNRLTPTGKTTKAMAESKTASALATAVKKSPEDSESEDEEAEEEKPVKASVAAVATPASRKQPAVTPIETPAAKRAKVDAPAAPATPAAAPVTPAPTATVKKTLRALIENKDSWSMDKKPLAGLKSIIDAAKQPGATPEIQALREPVANLLAEGTRISKSSATGSLTDVWVHAAANKLEALVTKHVLLKALTPFTQIAMQEEEAEEEERAEEEEEEAPAAVPAAVPAKRARAVSEASTEDELETPKPKKSVSKILLLQEKKKLESASKAAVTKPSSQSSAAAVTPAASTKKSFGNAYKGDKARNGDDDDEDDDE